MSVRAQQLRWIPDPAAWVMLAGVIAAGFLGNWWVAFGVAVLLLIYAARPLDLITAYLLVTGGTVFANYQGDPGTLTRQLTPISLGIVVMLFLYVLTKRRDAVSVPISDLSWPLLAYVLLSAINAVRGFGAGYPRKHLLIEIYPVLQLGSAFLLANVFEAKRDLKLVTALFVTIAFASACYGYVTFARFHAHITGVYFESVPGMAGLLFFNMALRTRRPSTSLGWLALSLPFFLHQFLSFGRGIWLGNLAGILASVLIFSVGRGRAGWARGGALLGAFVAVGLLGAVALTVVYGSADILLEAGTRFTSIGETELKTASGANVARLIEYAHVIRDIQGAPWFGYGLGYSFYVHSPLISEHTRLQYWVHENYLLVWLKQGLVGLVIFVSMLWSAFAMSARAARRLEDPSEAAWMATAAASTALMAMFAVTDFPFDAVQTMFVVAMFWGTAMGIANRGFLRLRWSAREPIAEPERA